MFYHGMKDVEIQDYELAQAYTIEFEEMWGSDTNIPDPDSSKFSIYKTDNEAGGDTISGCFEKSNDLSLNKNQDFPESIYEKTEN